MTELTEKQLFALLNVKHPTVTSLRHFNVDALADWTSKFVEDGTASSVFQESGAYGMMVNGGTSMQNMFRFTADFDISVVPPVVTAYSRSKAKKGLAAYLDWMQQQAEVEIKPMDPNQDFYPEHYKEVAIKHGCIRYYVIDTIDVSRIPLNQAEEIRAAIHDSCKSVGCDVPDCSTKIPFVTLIDAGVDAVIPMIVPKDVDGKHVTWDKNNFYTRLAYMDPLEEGIKKYFAILDENSNRNPMLLAKNLYDFYLRNSVWNRTLPLQNAQFNPDVYFKDLVLCLLPVNRGTDGRDFMPYFSRIDPEIKDNVIRVEKGLKGLRKVGMISMTDEQIKTWANALLKCAWSTSQDVFGLTKEHRKNRDHYAVNVSDAVRRYWTKYASMDEVITESYRGVIGEDKSYRDAVQKRHHDTAAATIHRNSEKMMRLVTDAMSADYIRDGVDTKNDMAAQIVTHAMHVKQHAQRSNFVA